MWNLMLITLGLAGLIGGGELLVRGASRVALLAKIPPAVVGLTVVAAGTSMPELVVSVQAAMAGTPDLSVGNVVGSNIYNIALILGIAALIRPLDIRGVTVRLEWPVMFLSGCALYVLGHDATVDRVDGGFLLLCLVAFVVWMVRMALRDATPQESQELGAVVRPAHDRRAVALAVGGALFGIALLGLGARWLVTGATVIATDLGVSQRVIGLTVVAIGTSLPELFASAMASLRGQSDIAVANVVGSNIFNALGILGATAVITPLPVHPDILSGDLPWMIGVSLLLLPLMWTGRRVMRWEGVLLLLAAILYTARLFTPM